MFSLREFVTKGLMSAIGIQSDYWVILTAANWFQKGVLTEEDLEEINSAVDEKNERLAALANQVEEPIEESAEELEEEPGEVAVEEQVEEE